jgi:hypothetical protein
MKTLPAIASLAALVAFVVSPTPAVAGSLCFGVSLVTIFAADYARMIKPLAPRAILVTFPAAVHPAQTCELAA